VRGTIAALGTRAARRFPVAVVDPFSSTAGRREILPDCRSYEMADKHQHPLDDEPIGIIISRGRNEHPAPRFAAYVWGVAEEPELSPVEAKAK
jgi:hypothetical protein